MPNISGKTLHINMSERLLKHILAGGKWMGSFTGIQLERFEASGGASSGIGATTSSMEHTTPAINVEVQRVTRIRTQYLGRWLRKCEATCMLLRGHPALLAVTVLVFATLCAAGLAGVLTAASYEVAKARDLATNGIGNQVAQSLKEALKTSMFASELLSAVVVQLPHCKDLEAAWPHMTRDIMSRVDPEVVQQLELDVAAVIWKAHPPFPEKLSFLYGRDLLREPDDRPGLLYALAERRTLILGPYTCKEGFKCAFTVSPIFLPAPDESYDWGCGFQPYNCSDLCWDPVNGTKFWGQVSTMLNLDPFFNGSDYRLVMLRERGYHYVLHQFHTSSSNPEVMLANSTESLTDPVEVHIGIENLIWHLALAPASGWAPSWRKPCICAVVLGSLCVALLVWWLLVSREQHNLLLRAMLPAKVIQQLQDGAQAIAEHFDSVSVLFSDIVGYTTVASRLTPFQVVTLLNELFTVFDELTARNGVYKVETIGDALMVVAGCPVPDDPAHSAQRAARMALDMIHAVAQFRPSLEGVQVQIRVGIHSGPVVAGVVGRRMPRYCLFGDTVNTASRMESTSEPQRIQVSATTAALLRSLPGQEFLLEPRGLVDVKGKGPMETFFLSSCSSADDSRRVESLSEIVSKPIRRVTILHPAPTPPSSSHSSRAINPPGLHRVRSDLGTYNDTPITPPQLPSRAASQPSGTTSVGAVGAASPLEGAGLGGGAAEEGDKRCLGDSAKQCERGGGAGGGGDEEADGDRGSSGERMLRVPAGALWGSAGKQMGAGDGGGSCDRV